MEAPRYMPEDMKAAFTLNNQIPLYDWYFNNIVPKNNVNWSNKYLTEIISRFTLENIRKGVHGKEPYNNAAKFHLKIGRAHV